MPFIRNFQIGLLSKEEQHPVLRATVVDFMKDFCQLVLAG
jgi:hypothetical protein